LNINQRESDGLIAAIVFDRREEKLGVILTYLKGTPTPNNALI